MTDWVDRVTRIAGFVCGGFLLAALAGSFLLDDAGLQSLIPLPVLESIRSRERYFLSLAGPFVLVGSMFRPWKVRLPFYALALLARYGLIGFSHFPTASLFSPFWASGFSRVTFTASEIATRACFYGPVVAGAFVMVRGHPLAWRLTGFSAFAGCTLGVASGALCRFSVPPTDSLFESDVFIGALALVSAGIYRTVTRGESNQIWQKRLLMAVAAVAALPCLIFPAFQSMDLPDFRVMVSGMRGLALFMIDWLVLTAVLQVSFVERR